MQESLCYRIADDTGFLPTCHPPLGFSLEMGTWEEKNSWTSQGTSLPPSFLFDCHHNTVGYKIATFLNCHIVFGIWESGLW